MCFDQIRLYYMMMEEAELYHCKTTTTGSYVCTQSRAVISRNWQVTSAVTLLYRSRNITKIVRRGYLSEKAQYGLN